MIGTASSRCSSSVANERTAGAMRATAPAIGRASREGCVAVCTTPRATSSRLPGGASGNQGTGGSAFGGRAVASCSSVMISVPRSTSIAAWCSLVSSAKLSFGRSSRLSSPSIT